MKNEYQGFQGTEEAAVRTAVSFGRLMLDQVLKDLDILYRGTLGRERVEIFHFRTRDVEGALSNIFSIDIFSENLFEARGRLLLVKENFKILRDAIVKPFRKIKRNQAPYGATDGDAFVGGPSPKLMAPIYFLPSFFGTRPFDQAALIVHELAHLKLQGHHHAHHPGMKGTGSDVKPHEDKKKLFGDRKDFFSDAVFNPYCYQWFTLAVSPSYDPSRYGAVVFGDAAITSQGP